MFSSRGLGVILLCSCLAMVSAHAEGTLMKASIPSKRLIVFVHGFISGAENTWKNESSGAYWPALLLERTESLTLEV